MTLTPTQRPTSMTNELHPGEVLTAGQSEAIAHNLCSLHGFSPAHVLRQELFAKAVITEYRRLSASDEGRGSLPAAPSVPTERGESDELDLYDDKVQEAISWTMRQWGEALGLTTWTQGDGSESVEGDVHAEIHGMLVDAGLRDPETNSMATLAHPQEAASVPGEGKVRVAALSDAVAALASIAGLAQSAMKMGVTALQDTTATHPTREDGPAGQAVVPVDLLNEVAGVLDCEGYSSLSLSLLNRLTSGPAAPTKEPA